MSDTLHDIDEIVSIANARLREILDDGGLRFEKTSRGTIVVTEGTKDYMEFTMAQACELLGLEEYA